MPGPGAGSDLLGPAGGWVLTGKHRGRSAPKEGTRIAIRALIDVPCYWNEQTVQLVDVVYATAQEIGVSPARVALGWLLGNPLVTAPAMGSG